jgi:hypothetical protein
MDQHLKFVEGERSRFNRTYMKLPSEMVDSIFNIFPIRIANLRGDLKLSPPNTNRIAGLRHEYDINDGNFSRVTTTCQ